MAKVHNVKNINMNATIATVNKNQSYTNRILVFTLSCLAVSLLHYLDNNNPRMHADFDVFYVSSQALIKGLAPYQYNNFNPPIFFILFKPLTYFNKHAAYLIWTCLNASMYFFACKTCLSLIIDKNKNYTLYYWAILCSFPVLTSIIIGQITSLIFILIIYGYKYLTLKKNNLCALCWSLATAIKFFPGLLIFYLIKQKKYPLSFTYAAMTLFIISLPLFFYGFSLYLDYLHIMSHIKWFSHSWNLSLFSLPFKFYLIKSSPLSTMLFLKKMAYCLSFIGFLTYIKILFFKKLDSVQQFNLTICFMLILSPLGWIYYLPILCMPILSLINNIDKLKPFNKLILLIAICCLYLPIENSFLPSTHYLWPLVIFYYCLPSIGLMLIAPLTLSPLSNSQTITAAFDKGLYLFITALSITIIYTHLMFLQYILQIIF